jgi:hypothetical protein
MSHQIANLMLFVDDEFVVDYSMEIFEIIFLATSLIEKPNDI